MPGTLEIVLIFLAASVGIVALARKFHLPPLLGYLLAGILIGPNALGFVPNTPENRYLAEFGVVFLMFSIGLEFNLPKLMAMRAVLFGFGLAQVAVTAVLGVAGALAIGLGWQAGVALGGALAMSSTAILVKLLADRADTPARVRVDQGGSVLTGTGMEFDNRYRRFKLHADIHAVYQQSRAAAGRN